MTLLDLVRNALDRPAQPAGDPAAFARLRDEAYALLFGDHPERIIPHEAFQRPANMGGRIDVHVYDALVADERVQIVVTSGLSDYAMRDEEGRAVRREVVQYFRQATEPDIEQLHYYAWTPLAARFCVDVCHTAAAEGGGPGALFLSPLVSEHREFSLELAGDRMELLWLVPLSAAEMEFKVRHGVEALLERMDERKLPWIYEAASRPALV